MQGKRFLKYSHLPLSLHLHPSFLLLFPLLLVQGIPLAQRPAEDVDALRRRGWSLSAGSSGVGPGTRTGFSPTIPFRFSRFGALFGPFAVPRPRPRAATFLAVLAAFGVLGPGRAATPRAAHVDHLC